MFCVYLLIISASVVYAFAMARIARASKEINGDKIRQIEQEKNKVDRLTEMIVDVIAKVIDCSIKVNEDIEVLDEKLLMSENKLGDITRENEVNLEGIQEQKEMTSNIAHLINDVASDVDKASDFTKKTLKELEKSKKSYRDLKIWSNQIYKNNKQVIKVVEEFVENVRRVGNITNDINYISDETNLLSFNTYVKSARAGNVGKGFEVVASKIRELSVNIAVLTEDINGIVIKLENNANVVQDVIKDVVGNINEESKTIDKTMEDFMKMDNDIQSLSENVYSIFDRVNKVTSFNKEIEKNIKQLNASSEGVTKYTNEISDLNKDSKEKINKTREVMTEVLEIVEKLDQYYLENYNIGD